MINEIRSAFKEALDRLGWMDDTTRQAAKEKVDQKLRQMDEQNSSLGFVGILLSFHRQMQSMT